MPPKAAPRRAATRGGATTESPAGTATPTPAPSAQGARHASSQPPGSSESTPRSGVQRLQSLKKRTPGGSLIPPNPDGSKPKPTLKYQPRTVIRRSKEERDAAQKLEESRHKERLAEVAAARRGRGGDGRGRGGGMRGGRGGGRGGADAGGPLGAGRYGRSNKGDAGARGQVSMISGGSQRDEDGVSSDDDDDGAPLFSIEQINIVSDDEDEGIADDKNLKGKGPARGSRSRINRGMRPVRLERHEHVERTVGVNTEASSTTSAELRRQAQETAQAEEDEELFVQDGSAETGKIKQEPTDDGDVVMSEAIPSVHEVSSDDPTARLPAKSAKKPPKRVQIRDPKSLAQTEEEKQESARHEYDIEMLKQALGSVSTKGKESAEGAEGAEGEGEGEEGKKEADEDAHNDRLYLIQFPPMTPNLLLPKDLREQPEATADVVQEAPSPPGAGETAVKKEGGDATQPGSAAASAARADGSATPVVAAAPPTQEAPKIVTALNHTQLPAGYVGKLNLHRSGRTTLDWGGISLELSRGSDVDFLQDAVIVAPPTEGESRQKMWAMSQVNGKFVVLPDWNSLLS